MGSWLTRYYLADGSFSEINIDMGSLTDALEEDWQIIHSISIYSSGYKQLNVAVSDKMANELKCFFLRGA